MHYRQQRAIVNIMAHFDVSEHERRGLSGFFSNDEQFGIRTSAIPASAGFDFIYNRILRLFLVNWHYVLNSTYCGDHLSTQL